MSIVKIENSIPNGSVLIPPSKSVAHRALICSFLAGGGEVNPIINSNDMKATQSALKALESGEETIDCIESGSTLRFLIPVAAALGKSVKFIGQGKLPERPIKEYETLLTSHGVNVVSNGGLPFSISGKLTPGCFEIAGNVSSQYITGLLFALPLLEGDSEIVITTEFQSKPYADMTVKVLREYGIKLEEKENGYLVFGNQSYKKRDYTVESDWSQAAFFLVAGALGGDVTLFGLDINSLQGDKEIIDVLRHFGAEISVSNDTVRCRKGELKGIEVDAKNIPDIIPIISVVAAFSKGETVIKNASRLRLKESDRIKSILTNLKLMGVSVVETDDGMKIQGGDVFGAKLFGFNDHRIVMAFSVAALFAKGESEIDDALSINKSYPTFFEDLNSLGGKANVINNR